jgi:hypothetical protein
VLGNAPDTDPQGFAGSVGQVLFFLHALVGVPWSGPAFDAPFFIHVADRNPFLRSNSTQAYSISCDFLVICDRFD